MSALLWHPAIAYGLGMIALLLLPTRARAGVLLGTSLAALVMVELLAARGTALAPPLTYLGFALQPIRADGLGLLFARIFALSGCIALLFGLKEQRRAVHLAALATVGCALGVVLAGDLLTLFVAWELKALATTMVVLFGGMVGSVRAAQRYFLIHAAGGGVLLLGIVLWLAAGHGLSFGAMPLDGVAVWLLLGFALCAAVPPLHAWMTDAYPEASPFGMVLLSVFTTKSAVYALARGFPGVELLVWVGAVMAIYGVAFAILENDIRRFLAYHIVSQVGFMVCGVGMGVLSGDPSADKVGALALNGTAAHAVCHILYKGLLLMSTGAVVYATGKRKLSELGGLWRLMPATLVLYMVGAFSISGVPLWNGFVSKSMVISAAEYGHRGAIEWMLLTASVGTFLSTGLKLPWFVFFGAERGHAPLRRLPWNMTAAMAVAAVLCTLLGVFPDPLYRLLPYAATYEPFTLAHVLSSLQLLLGTALGFVLLLPYLRAQPVVVRDAGLLYRLIGQGFVVLSRRAVVPFFEAAAASVMRVSGQVPLLGQRIAGMTRAPVGFWVMVAVGTLALLVFAL